MNSNFFLNPPSATQLNTTRIKPILIKNLEKNKDEATKSKAKKFTSLLIFLYFSEIDEISKID